MISCLTQHPRVTKWKLNFRNLSREDKPEPLCCHQYSDPWPSTFWKRLQPPHPPRKSSWLLQMFWPHDSFCSDLHHLHRKLLFSYFLSNRRSSSSLLSSSTSTFKCHQAVINSYMLWTARGITHLCYPQMCFQQRPDEEHDLKRTTHVLWLRNQRFYLMLTDRNESFMWESFMWLIYPDSFWTPSASLFGIKNGHKVRSSALCDSAFRLSRLCDSWIPKQHFHSVERVLGCTVFLKSTPSSSSRRRERASERGTEKWSEREANIQMCSSVRGNERSSIFFDHMARASRLH